MSQELQEAPIIHSAVSCAVLHLEQLSMGVQVATLDGAVSDTTSLVQNKAVSAALEDRLPREFNVVVTPAGAEARNTFSSGGHTTTAGGDDAVQAPANGLYALAVDVHVPSSGSESVVALQTGQYLQLQSPSNFQLNSSFSVDTVWKGTNFFGVALTGIPIVSTGTTSNDLNVSARRHDSTRYELSVSVLDTDILDAPIYVAKDAWQSIAVSWSSKHNTISFVLNGILRCQKQLASDAQFGRQFRFGTASGITGGGYQYKWIRFHPTSLTQFEVSSLQPVTSTDADGFRTEIDYGDSTSTVPTLSKNGAPILQIPSLVAPPRVHVLVNDVTVKAWELHAAAATDISLSHNILAAAGDVIRVDSVDADAPVNRLSVTSLKSDSTAIPRLTLEGAGVAVLERDSPFTDPGFTATETDPQGQTVDRQAHVTVAGTIDTTSPGKQHLTYTLPSSDGVTTVSRTRVVLVIDTVVPTIILTGPASVSHTRGLAYVDVGASAFDGQSRNITSLIRTDNAVDADSVGLYTVTYNVMDSEGNHALEVSRAVTVVDSDPPVITVAAGADGAVPQTVERFTPYTDPGATASDTDGGPVAVTTINGVNTDEVGVYTVIYQAQDQAGNFAVQRQRTVTVVDTVKPVIALVGPSSVVMERLGTYVDAGATAFDYSPSGEQKTNLTSSIVVTNPVDATQTGTYTVTYAVQDASGNAADTVQRTVEVRDTTPPVITLLGQAAMSIERLSTFADPGATALDGDVDYTSSIVASNNIDSSQVGEYHVHYDVLDAEANAAVRKTRTVSVVDTTKPRITLNGPGTVTVQRLATYADQGAVAFDYSPLGVQDDNADLTSAIAVTNPVDVSASGTYTVRYNVSDASGNAADEVTRTVTVQDTTGPAIAILGDNPVTLERLVPAYNDAGATATDGNALSAGDGSSFSHAITVQSNANGEMKFFIDGQESPAMNFIPGNHYYFTQDDASNAGHLFRFSATPDGTHAGGTEYTDATEIVVHGVAGTAGSYVHLKPTATTPSLYYYCAHHPGMGGQALITLDELTSSIVATSNVDVTTAGTYQVSYSCADAHGNSSSATRTVIVQDTTKPRIFLTGPASIVLERNAQYVDQGATAYDMTPAGIQAEDLTGSVQTDLGGLDSAVIGTYTISYSVSDASGNAADQKTRTVEVADNTPPQITILGDNPATVERTSTYVDGGASATDGGTQDLTGDIVTTSSSPVASQSAAIKHISASFSLPNYPVAQSGAIPTGNWNNIEIDRIGQVVGEGVPGPAVSEPLVDSLGQSTGATLNLPENTAVNTWASMLPGASWWTTDTDAQTYQGADLDAVIEAGILFHTYLWTLPPITIENIPSEFTSSGYDVRVYIAPVGGDPEVRVEDSDGFSQLSQTEVRTMLYPQSASGTDAHGTVPWFDGTYAYFTGLTGSTLTITPVNPHIVMSGVTGIQITSAAAAPAAGSATVPTDTTGTHTITYTVADSEGNQVQATRTVNVVDTVPPQMSLNGAASVTVERAAVYNDAGVAAFDHKPDGSADADVDLSAQVAVDVVARSLEGTNQWSVSVVTDAGGARFAFSDGTKTYANPVFTLTAGETYVFDQSDASNANHPIAFRNQAPGDVAVSSAGTPGTSGAATSFEVPAGAASLRYSCALHGDGMGNTISVRARSDPVNTDTVQTFSVLYSVSDAAGNEAAPAQRQVVVVDTVSPSISLTGGTVTLERAVDTYVEPGFSAADGADDLTSAVVVSNNVDAATVGDYHVNYDVTDKSGNVATRVSRQVLVRDTRAPEITVTGGTAQTVERYTTYTDPGATAVDDGSVSVAVTASGAVDTSTPGVYTLTYQSTDAAGNTASATRQVTVSDTNDPVVTITGANPTYVELGSGYTELGATATDGSAGPALAVTTSGSVDTNATGSYYITYTATDSTGRSGQASRQVVVRDTTAPVITLVGSETVQIDAGDAFTDPGATVYDLNSTSGVQVTGSVDASVPGTYTIQYNATDASGNAAAEVQRTVIVAAASNPSVSLSGSATMTIQGGAPWTEPGATFQSTDTRKHISINKLYDYGDHVSSHEKGLYFSTCKNSDALQLRSTYFQANDPYKFDLYFGRPDHSVTFEANLKQRPIALYGDASLAQYADSRGFLSPSQVPDSQVNGGSGIGNYGTTQYVDTTTATRFRGFVYSYDPDNDGHFGITFNVSGMDFYFVLDGQVLSPTGTDGGMRRWYNVFLTQGLHSVAWYMLPNGPDALYELVDFNYTSDAYPHIAHVTNPAMWFGLYVAGMEYRPDLVYYTNSLPQYHNPLFVTIHPLQKVMNAHHMTYYDFGVRDTAGAVRVGNWNNLGMFDMARTQQYFTKTYNKSFPLRDSYGNATGAELSVLPGSLPGTLWDVHQRGHRYTGTIDDNQLFFSKANINPTLRVENLPAEYTSGGYEVRLYFNMNNAGYSAYTVTDSNGYSSTLYLYQAGRNGGWPLAAAGEDPLGGASGYRGSVDTQPTGTETTNYLLFQGLSGSQVDITPASGYEYMGGFVGMQISSNPTADASAITVPAFASLPRASNGNLVRTSEMMETPGTYTITYSGYEDTEPTLRTVVVTDL